MVTYREKVTLNRAGETLYLQNDEGAMLRLPGNVFILELDEGPAEYLFEQAEKKDISVDKLLYHIVSSYAAFSLLADHVGSEELLEITKEAGGFEDLLDRLADAAEE